jgi:hypothetical protein
MFRAHREAARRRTCRRRRTPHLYLEGLESRIALSTFNVVTEADLRSAIAAADSNGDASNTINVTASILLDDTSAGPLEIQDGGSTAKTLTIEGQGAAPSDTMIEGDLGVWNTRVLEVVGTGASKVTVIFMDV